MQLTQVSGVARLQETQFTSGQITHLPAGLKEYELLLHLAQKKSAWHMRQLASLQGKHSPSFGVTVKTDPLTVAVALQELQTLGAEQPRQFVTVQSNSHPLLAVW